jgi:hypothetical protein
MRNRPDDEEYGAGELHLPSEDEAPSGEASSPRPIVKQTKWLRVEKGPSGSLYHSCARTYFTALSLHSSAK